MNKSVFLLGGGALLALLALSGTSKASEAPKPVDPPKPNPPKPSPCPAGTERDPDTGLCLGKQKPSPKPIPKPGPIAPTPNVSGADCAALQTQLSQLTSQIQAASGANDFLTVASLSSKLASVRASMTAAGCSASSYVPTPGSACPEGQVLYDGACVPMEWVGMTPAPAGQGPALPPCPDDTLSEWIGDCINASGQLVHLRQCAPGMIWLDSANACVSMESVGLAKAPAGQGPALPRCPDDGSNPGYDCVDGAGNYQLYGQQAAAMQTSQGSEGYVPSNKDYGWGTEGTQANPSDGPQNKEYDW